MRRREFVAALGAAVAWPLEVNAQRRLRRIGILVGAGNDSQGDSRG